ncbi:solanidine UDP-glucose glucosyltransferase 1-like [Lycium ferocissimum]|uniref:solanidine UDP-glucose glucosyltransferase 1-like n=1 Tax=Lycium ferocissimum TaxID=112874 RepID=UPI00281623EA|nr:solanidine UDP-glucose glucosyltransferase 1-like [Lycium ferocissimum]
MAPHVVFLPYSMMSHLTALVQIARLFAFHGLRVTIITTPHNALVFQSLVDKDRLVSGRSICIRTLKFPSNVLGLPEGIENLVSTPNVEIAGKVHYGVVNLLQKPLEQMIRQLNPNCIVSDMLFHWTVDLAEELHIPRFSFQPVSFFCQCVRHCLREYTPHNKVDSDSERFTIPGLLHEIKMKRSEIEDFLKEETYYGKMVKSVVDADLRSHGIIHNTCSLLEPGYAELYEKIRGRKGWHVGPLSLFINKLDDVKRSKEIHNSNFSVPNWKESDDCLSWLEDQDPNSVLFVCFGSSTRFSNDQLREITLALKEANCPFVLVVKEQQDHHDGNSNKEMLNKNGKCFIIKGWAPQVIILKHRAIGGFMTHCGWNSILEALTLGVPLITWPLFSEQFHNANLLEQLGLAIRVGADMWNSGFIVSCPVISREKIESAVKRLMCDSEDSRKIRANVKLMVERLNSASEEGGSSHSDLIALIEEIKRCAFNNST